LIRTIEKIDATRKRLLEGALRTFEKQFGEIRNEPTIELPPVAERPIDEQLHRLVHESKAEPVRFENVQRGKGGARFAALIAALLTLAVLLGAGARYFFADSIGLGAEFGVVMVYAKGKTDVRTVMRFHPAIAPIKLGVFPLVKIDSHESAGLSGCSNHFMSVFDSTRSWFRYQNIISFLKSQTINFS